MKRTFIPQSHMPPTLPFQETAMQILLCHYFSAPAWLWAMSIFCMACLWITRIHNMMVSNGRRIPGFGWKDGE